MLTLVATDRCDHNTKLEFRRTACSGYGGMTDYSNKPWLICTCGHQEDLFGDMGRYEFARLNHLVRIVALESGISID